MTDTGGASVWTRSIPHASGTDDCDVWLDEEHLNGCTIEEGLAIAVAGTPFGVASNEYGVSTQTIACRINTTRACHQAEAMRLRRR